MTVDEDRAELDRLMDEIDDACEAGDLHEAKRLTVLARNLARRLDGQPAVTPQPNGGRPPRQRQTAN